MAALQHLEVMAKVRNGPFFEKTCLGSIWLWTDRPDKPVDRSKQMILRVVILQRTLVEYHWLSFLSRSHDRRSSPQLHELNQHFRARASIRFFTKANKRSVRKLSGLQFRLRACIFEQTRNFFLRVCEKGPIFLSRSEIHGARGQKSRRQILKYLRP